MRGARATVSEIAGGGLALVFIAGFVILALLPLTNFGGNFAFDARAQAILRFTLYQATLSTLLSVVFGAIVALSVARQRGIPGRVWLIRFMAAPMGLPALAGTFGVIAVWGNRGAINSVLSFAGFGDTMNVYGLAGILIAHTFFNIPLAARLFLASLERSPPQYWLMAANLGMGRFSVFRLIELPILMKPAPGIAGLIFMLCATSFTLVLTLGGGPAATTLEVAIYQALKFDFDPSRAVFLVVIQVALMALILMFLSVYPTIQEERSVLSTRIRRFDAQGFGALLSDGGIIVAFLLFCGSPFVALVQSGLGASFPHLFADPQFRQAVLTSFVLGTMAALFAVTLSYALALARVKSASRVFAGLLAGAGSLILVVPPIVLATGWFLWLRGGGDYAPFILVPLINALMALPFCLRVLEPALRVHVKRSSRLCESLGVRGFARLRIIDLPALSKPLLMAFCFALALSLGDLGAVALFGGDRLVTLPWLLYAKLGSYRTTDAAALAFILAVLCMTLAVLGTPDERQERG